MAETYEVGSGETLAQIALANDMTVSQLLALNPEIEDADNLSVGQELNLTSEPSEPLSPAALAEGETTEKDKGKGAGGGGDGSGGVNVVNKDVKLHGVPGSPRVWMIGNKTFLVYTIPDTKPPVLVRWQVPKNELKALFGPDKEFKYNRVITAENAKKLGMVDAGVSTQLANFDADPFTTWAETMEDQAAVAPWILDDDYQAMLLEATLEGRELSEAEIQGTDWWQSHNEAQRSWMKLYHGDKMTADQTIQDNRIAAAEALRMAGVDNASNRLINYVADQATTGNWSEAYFNQQVTAIADPFSGIEIDAGAAEFLNKKLDTTQREEDTVKDLLEEWLGPVYGGWEDERIAKWAGKLRNNPDAEIELVEKLQNQRLALFPEMDDRTVSYQDMASPWRQFVQTEWGQQADETDPLFMKLLQNNDAMENGKLLRRAGVNRGIGKVMQTLSLDALADEEGLVRASARGTL